MLKPIIILVTIGAIGLVGYRVFAQKDEPTQMSETVLLINDANKSVQDADLSIEKANTSFKKVPLSEYKTNNKKSTGCPVTFLNFTFFYSSKVFYIKAL